MATLTIRQLDDDVYERLKARARANKRSLEAEARHALGERYRSIADIADDMMEFHKRMVAKHGYLPDSTPLIRQMRDEE